MGYKRSVGDLPASANVVIIGGGFAGVATAWALQRLGIAEVIVLERDIQLGRFASGRSAGLGRQLAEDEDTTALTVRGADILRTMPIWAPTGGVLSFDDVENANAYIERGKRFGVAVEPGPKELVMARWPQLPELRVARALFVPSDGTIDVNGLLNLLAQGVRVEVSTAVVAIESEGRGAKVVTSRGAITARVVVDASGAWAGELVGGERLTAFKRHVFILDAVTSVHTPWLWHLGAGEMYMRVDGQGVLASPCDAARCPPGHQEADLVGEAHMRKLLDEADSPLGGLPITRRWACQRAFAEDRKMRLGRDPNRPWLVWAAGLGGHGATASPAIGERVASAVVEAL
jgi:glycine/D-amino acid oxidase-like deaminating enzyme